MSRSRLASRLVGLGFAFAAPFLLPGCQKTAPTSPGCRTGADCVDGYCCREECCGVWDGKGVCCPAGHGFYCHSRRLCYTTFTAAEQACGRSYYICYAPQ